MDYRESIELSEATILHFMRAFFQANSGKYNMLSDVSQGVNDQIARVDVDTRRCLLQGIIHLGWCLLFKV